MPTFCGKRFGAFAAYTCGTPAGQCPDCRKKDEASKQKEENQRDKAIEDGQNKKEFKFYSTSYERNSDFEFHASGRTWYLHKSILQKRCPAFLDIDQNRLESFAFSQQIYEALITFIYQDQLVQSGFLELIDLHMLVVVCDMQELGDYLLSQIDCSKQATNNIAAAFCKLMKYPEFNSKLFDLLYSHICDQENCKEAITSLIKEASESFAKLALCRTLYVRKTAITSITSPFGKLSELVQELFPSRYAQGDLQAASSSSKHDTTNYTIKCEGQTFPCHKLLLVLRWPYFAKAMSFNGVEATTNTMELAANTLSAKSTEVFIRYLYTNTVPPQMPASIAHNILSNALHFEMFNQQNIPVPSMSTLIDYCRSVVFGSLRMDNCVSYLKGALEYGNNEQVNQARTFIAQIIRNGQIQHIQDELKSLPPEEALTLLTWKS